MAISRTLPDHATHRHWWYGLTCSQYEELLALCGQRCQTCHRHSTDVRGGKLFIDHDGSIGQWAVRGLLCGRCNATLRYDRPAPEWAADYLANPWYEALLRQLGISLPVPEPQIGRVLDFYDRLWFHRPEGWTTGHKACGYWDWHWVVWRFGPHNLTPYTQKRGIVCRGRVIG